MKCYKTLFSIEGIINNQGNYITSIIILFTIILSILFKIKGYNILKDKINKIIINNNIEINNPNKKIKKRIINIMKTNDEITNNTNIKLNLKSSNNYIDKIENNNNDILKFNNFIEKNEYKLNNIKYNDYELNNLNYNDALKIDKRTYIQYYFSLLRMKHILIFTFYTNNDYNSRIIKIILFLFSFSLYFTINALFFSDSTIHKIYEDYGSYNFIYQLPNIFYSTIITSFIDLIIKYFSLSEKDVLKLKKEKNNINENKNKLLKLLKIKFLIFFILVLLFLILFWYYLSCFCAVYRNTQIHLIKDTLISFGLSLIYPLLLNLIPGIFRIPSLIKHRICIYRISKIIQLI